MLHASDNQTRLIARIVWEALKGERFESLADLTADVKTRCARLRLRVTADDLNAAYTLIESNHALILPHAIPAHRDSENAGSQTLTADQARDILARIRARLKAPPVKAMPPVRLITRRQGDRFKALQIVSAEIVAAVQRCEELEGGLVGLPREPGVSADIADGVRTDQPAAEDGPC